VGSGVWLGGSAAGHGGSTKNDEQQDEGNEERKEIRVKDRRKTEGKGEQCQNMATPFAVGRGWLGLGSRVREEC
jgi:hypothetical protein